jgi:hypothetical protein
MQKLYLSRSQSRAWSSELPVGDPYGGAAFGEFNDPGTAMAGASIVGGLMNADAASSAADAQSQSSQAAIGEQRRQYDQNRADNAPFRDTGVFANARLRQLLGLDSGYAGTDSGSLLSKFSQNDLNNDPVYNSGLQFGLDQGTGAINARALAGGSYDSGATLKALTRYGNDYGSTKAGDAYNRFNNDQSNIYNKLAGVSGAGQTATNSITNAGTNMANNVSNLQTGIGNASAAGIVGGANAWNNAASTGINNYQNNQFMNYLNRNKNNSGGGYSHYGYPTDSSGNLQFDP